VTNRAAFTAEFDKACGSLRYPLRGLVTCAGISGEHDAMSYPEDRVKKIFDVNFNGSFWAAQAAARQFYAADVPGSIVLIASMSGTIANRGLPTSAYNSSKAAVQQLARSLAAEWGRSDSSPGLRVPATGKPPIRVNSVSPGHVRTPITAEALAKGDEGVWSEGNLLGRLASVEEMRGPVLFLLAEASSYVTGSDLKVDGGTTAW
jgi:NAD(P)-dependent dehydrogenase (short-subunit alcohol dehydrogenase family)